MLPGFLILTGAWGMAGFLTFVPLHASSLGLDGAGIPLAMYAFIVVALRIVFVRLPDEIGAARLSAAPWSVGAIGLVLMGTLPGAVGLFVSTAVFAAGIAFMFPALIAVAVGLVDESERGIGRRDVQRVPRSSFGLVTRAARARGRCQRLSGCVPGVGRVSAVGAAVLALRRRSLVPRPRPA